MVDDNYIEMEAILEDIREALYSVDITLNGYACVSIDSDEQNADPALVLGFEGDAVVYLTARRG